MEENLFYLLRINENNKQKIFKHKFKHIYF